MANFNDPIDNESELLNGLVRTIAVARKEPMTSSLFTDKQTAEFVSKESVTAAEMEVYRKSMGEIKNFLTGTEMFGNHELKEALGDLPTHSLEAAQIVLAAAANPLKHVSAQTKQRNYEGAENVDFLMSQLSSGPAGNLDLSPDQSISKESFDEQQLNEFLDYSIVFNAMASRQDEFNAAFYDPYTLTPDQTGYRITTRLEQVWPGKEHHPNGDAAPFVKRNLIDALTHPEILETNLTEVIPYVQKGGSLDNTKHFLDAALYTPTTTMLDEVEILTAPLKVNMAHNLLGLSSHPALIANGLMDDKDALDSRAAVRNVYLKVGTQLVRIPTQSLPTTGFYKSVEGGHRKMALTMDNNSFVVDARMKAVDGTVVQAFKPIVDAGYNLRLRIRLYGELEADSSIVEVASTRVAIAAAIRTADGVAVDWTKDATLKPLVDALKLTEDDTKVVVAGYDLEARRNNYNLRTRGRMIDSYMFAEQFTIPLRSPISIVKPIVGGEKPEPDVKSLIFATYIMANNDGVKTILNYADLLRSIVESENYNWETDRFGIPGIGRHWLQPCYFNETVHLPKALNNTSSENRLKDIQGVLVTKMNDMLSRMLQKTNYIPVVEQLTGGNPGSVTAVIGTDYRLPMYLTTQGDVRLFGDRIKHKVVSSPNKHMRNKIVITLTSDAKTQGPDPFKFGMFLWVPELMVSAQLTRGPHTYMQHLVQPRYLHVINCPIIGILNVTGLEDVTSKAAAYFTVDAKAEGVLASHTYGPEVGLPYNPQAVAKGKDGYLSGATPYQPQQAVTPPTSTPSASPGASGTGGAQRLP
nr:MAG TPA: major capsid protein [Caudoviricetes sp.]